MTATTLRTDRLTLRPLAPGDAVVLHRIYQSDGVLQYFPTTVPPPLERLERFVATQQEHWAEHGYGNWALVPDQETEIVGWAGLQFLPELGETEVGFLLDRPFWGRGFATEAARESIRVGFEVCELDHIIALTHPENTASRRVIEKCGMTRVETIHLWGIDLMRHTLDRGAWAETGR